MKLTVICPGCHGTGSVKKSVSFQGNVCPVTAQVKLVKR